MDSRRGLVDGNRVLVLYLTLGRTKGEREVDATPHKVFLSFFLEDKTSVPGVFSSCSFIPCALIETSSVMVSC